MLIAVKKTVRRGSLLLLFLLGTALFLSAANYSGVTPLQNKLPLCYPNPFQDGDTVNFVFNPKQEGVVDIRIYNVAGLLVNHLLYLIDMTTADDEPDEYSWDGRNSAGKSLANGVYVYVIRVTDPATKKEEKFIGKCYKY